MDSYRKIVLLSVIILAEIIASIETEINIPSFPDMMDYFNTSPQILQFIVGLNFIGICISSLIYGTISESYGRKKPLIIGYSIFALGSIGCSIFSTNLYMLLLCRFIQGCGCSSIFVIGSAIVFDIFNKREAAKFHGYSTSIICLAMANSPILGAYINERLGWQYNFHLIAVLSAFMLVLIKLFLPETLDNDKRIKFDINQVLEDYGSIIKDKLAIHYLNIASFQASGYLIYITFLPIIFINQLGLSTQEYSYHQASVTIAFAIASITTGFIVKKLGYVNTRNIAMVLTLVCSIAFAVIGISYPNSPVIITSLMCLVSACSVIFGIIIFGDYMEYMERIRGTASSFCTFHRLLVTSIMLLLTSLFFNETIVPIIVMLLVINSISCFTYRIVMKKFVVE